MTFEGDWLIAVVSAYWSSPRRMTKFDMTLGGTTVVMPQDFVAQEVCAQ